MWLLLQLNPLLHQDSRTLETIGGTTAHCVFYAPAGRDLEHHASRCTCGFLSGGGAEREKARPSEAGRKSILTAHIQARRRYVSTPPSNTEELRTKYKIMTNLWLLAQMREPGRKLYADLDKDTFMDFADELISEKIFLLEKQINGVKMVIPQREHCMNYE